MPEPVRCDGCHRHLLDVGVYWPDETKAIWGLCGVCCQRARLLDPRIGHIAILDQLYVAVHGAPPLVTRAQPPDPKVQTCPLCEGTGRFPRP